MQTQNVSTPSQGGLKNGALTEQFDDLKSFNLGETTWDPSWTMICIL
jgi:hypothetical protein